MKISKEEEIWGNSFFVYRKHDVFETPELTQPIWKYLSFAKFVWLIANKSLYFSRLDHLEDSWEGLLPSKFEKDDKRPSGKYLRFNKYINCWHMNDAESDAMWKVYGNSSHETVAIKSDVGSLIHALKAVPNTGEEPKDVFIGKVNYVENNITLNNFYHQVLYKRPPFAHEQELRLCVSSDCNHNPPDYSEIMNIFSAYGIPISNLELLKQCGNKGISVPVALDKLIHEIVICPNSEGYIEDSVNYVLQGKISTEKVKKSAMLNS